MCKNFEENPCSRFRMHKWSDKQTDKQTDKQIDKQTDKQTNGRDHLALRRHPSDGARQ